MNKRKRASYGKMNKMRGGDYMEPNKELQFGGLKRDPDKETYYGGPNTKAGRIKKRAENKKGRIESRAFGKRVKEQAKEDGMSNRAARIKGRGARKAYKATHTHSRANQTIGEKDKKAEKILKKSREKSNKVQDNADAKKKGKQMVKSARNVAKMKKGGPRKKALIGMGLGKLASTAGNLIGGKFGDTLSNVGNIAQNPLGAAKNAIQGNPLGQGLDQQTPPGQSGAAGVIGQVANALGGNQQQQPQQQTMKKGGKKRKKYQEGGGKMQKMKKKDAPQLAMSRDTRDWTEKELGVKNPSRAITKKEKDRRDSFRRPRHIKKPLSVMQEGGDVTPMKKKNVTGVNAKMASTRGSGIRGAKPVITKVTGTTDSKKGGNSGSSDEYKMRKGLKGTKSFAGKQYYSGSKMKTGGAKPDYLDMDKDGNKTEPMKSALKDRRSKAKYGKKKK